MKFEDQLAEAMRVTHRVMMDNLSRQLYSDNALSKYLGKPKPRPWLYRQLRRARIALSEKIFSLACFVAGENRWSDY